MKASVWLPLCSGLSRRGLKSPACKRSSRLKPTLFWRVRFSGLGFREAATCSTLWGISIASGAAKPTLFWRVRFSGLGFREAAISIAAGADSYDSNFAYTYNQVI